MRTCFSLGLVLVKLFPFFLAGSWFIYKQESKFEYRNQLLFLKFNRATTSKITKNQHNVVAGKGGGRVV